MPSGPAETPRRGPKPMSGGSTGESGGLAYPADDRGVRHDYTNHAGLPSEEGEKVWYGVEHAAPVASSIREDQGKPLRLELIEVSSQTTLMIVKENSIGTRARYALDSWLSHLTSPRGPGTGAKPERLPQPPSSTRREGFVLQFGNILQATKKAGKEVPGSHRRGSTGRMACIRSNGSIRAEKKCPNQPAMVAQDRRMQSCPREVSKKKSYGPEAVGQPMTGHRPIGVVPDSRGTFSLRVRF